MNPEQTNGPKKPIGLWLAVALLLIAFAVRIAALDAVPPGLTHDEIAQLGVADKIRAGDWRLFYPDNYGVEPLYHYALAASISMWGMNSLAMRMPEVFAGILGLACSYVLATRLFNREPPAKPGRFAIRLRRRGYKTPCGRCQAAAGGPGAGGPHIR